MRVTRKAALMAIGLAILLTAAAVLLILNFASGEKKIEHEIHAEYGVDTPQFRRTMGALLGPSVVDGNAVRALQNGDEIFPAMLEAIRSAEHTITFETYIYWSGEVGRAFADALIDRARHGVAVHVLLDWVGTGKMDDAMLGEMKDAGIQVDKFHPLRWYNLGRMNNRTHRKLLVVDGRIGFTGGVGIADLWQGHAQDSLHWRDSHYRIEGPAVAQMQAAFMDNWLKTRTRVLHGEGYFPPLPTSGKAVAQVFTSSPEQGSESVRLMYMLSLAAAERSIRIAASYFVPDSLVTATLVSAAERGVNVEIILPGKHIDATFVRKASRGGWGPLLEAGVQIYEYQPTMYHCKVMIVDDLWISVGSTNFDNRSFRLNAEANLNVLDREFALEQARQFELDKARSREITHAMWQARPFREKLAERFARLFRSQL
jgi:cardiolipin synthase